LGGNPIEGLIPGDAFKTPFTASAHAFQWVEETIFRIDPAPKCTPTQAGPDFMGAGRVIAGAVGFHTDDFSIPDNEAHRAAAAAVHVAGRPDEFFVILYCGQVVSELMVNCLGMV
jgi:hypothetical protein